MATTTVYEGVFLRIYIPQLPNWSPVGGLWEQCPDIGSGTTILDPAALVTGYDTTAGPITPFGLLQPNFIYVRAVNSAQTAITGRVWLFWVPMGTVLWPSTWQSAGITVAGQAVNYQSISLEAAPPWPDHTVKPTMSPAVATSLPFVVTPNVPSSTTDTFALVAIVENTPSTPPAPPLPQPFANASALATWVTTSGNVGWLTLTQQVQPASAPLVVTEAVSASGTVSIGAAGTGLPSDATISVQCQGPTIATSINVSQAVGSNPNPNLIKQVTWPSTFATSVTISVVPGATPIPANATLRVLLQTP